MRTPPAAVDRARNARCEGTQTEGLAVLPLALLPAALPSRVLDWRSQTVLRHGPCGVHVRPRRRVGHKQVRRAPPTHGPPPFVLKHRHCASKVRHLGERSAGAAEPAAASDARVTAAALSAGRRRRRRRRRRIAALGVTRQDAACLRQRARRRLHGRSGRPRGGRPGNACLRRRPRAPRRHSGAPAAVAAAAGGVNGAHAAAPVRELRLLRLPRADLLACEQPSVLRRLRNQGDTLRQGGRPHVGDGARRLDDAPLEKPLVAPACKGLVVPKLVVHHRRHLFISLSYPPLPSLHTSFLHPSSLL
eukprot:Rhum_TRINITY_DN15338_c0_g1::Rhum_TRINITY_DN15338_c0_g1_i1::g.149766::m.149766